jgi:hypothetical protein
MTATLITLSDIGSILATLGSLIAIYGTLVNNLKRDHFRAMQIWQYSNPILFIWAIGFCFNLWEGGFPGAFMAAMYLVFAVTNRYGLVKKQVNIKKE